MDGGVQSDSLFMKLIVFRKRMIAFSFDVVRDVPIFAAENGNEPQNIRLHIAQLGKTRRERSLLWKDRDDSLAFAVCPENGR